MEIETTVEDYLYTRFMKLSEDEDISYEERQIVARGETRRFLEWLIGQYLSRGNGGTNDNKAV